ncbi:MAG: PEGA domain-containing protein [Kofleriaceae bacterium]
MVRVVAALVVVGWVGLANAGPTRKVTIETVPPGAVVYLNAKEDGPVCEKTPCTFSAPIGETPLIVELAQHREIIQNLVVKKTGRLAPIKLRLERAIGVLVFEGPKGALITVDDVERGKAPKQVELSEEGHHVVVTFRGKTLYDEFIEVVAGDVSTVPVIAVATATDDDGSEIDDDRAKRPTKKSAKIVATTSAGQPHGSYFRITALMDVGFRTFFYDKPKVAEAPPDLEREYGQLLGGPLVEVWPMEIAKARALRGLSLFGRFQLGLNAQRVAGVNDIITTAWQSWEAGIRQRFRLGDRASFELGVGYGHDKYQYNSSDVTDEADAPEVDYESLRLRLRASGMIWRLEPYVNVEGRYVLSGGTVQARFPDGASVQGYGAGLGMIMRLGSFQLRGGASAMQYRWAFAYAEDATVKADAGRDTIFQLQLGLGYAY